jgi:hypothetical protein
MPGGGGGMVPVVQTSNCSPHLSLAGQVQRIGVLMQLISIKGLNSLSCYSGRWLYAGVPSFEKIF